MKNTFINEYETKQALADFIIKTDKLSMGETCFEFEKQFAEKQGRKEAVLFNSGGSANLAMFQALKNLDILAEGNCVGFSALTWSTNVMPLIQMDFNPVPVDCRPETLNVMSEELETIIDQFDLKAFFLTNALGFCGDLERIRHICEQHGVLLIEDNCESLGTILDSNNKTGNYGFGASFSFFVAHHMSTIEGGMVCTDDEIFAEMLRIVRANGWDRNLTAKQQIRLRKKYNVSSEFDAKYTFYDLGFNFRPTEITGFIGLTQLKYLDENIHRRGEIYKKLEDVSKNNDELIQINHSNIITLSPFAFPVLCKTPELRGEYFEKFSGAGIEIRPMIAGNMQKQPFFKKYIKEHYDLPGVDFIHDCGFYCGIYPEMSNSDIETIKSCLTRN
ncbi:MAG: DegT/DnrJ/EryC1/StrS aminotransferase family protein [Methanoregula sp.]|jgi:CDP-6-deoxy-D-xylo-4-hexulose-3-dehydrase|uniref:DegT/DnrJ/EryC1/StrS family aminotransferase n=1 Tax=Methanoregula sp. TaxID=2052170 RepID=UPI003C19C192